MRRAYSGLFGLGGGGTTDPPPTDGGAIDTGCGCRITPSPDRQGSLALFAAVAMLGRASRRRFFGRRY